MRTIVFIICLTVTYTSINAESCYPDDCRGGACELMRQPDSTLKKTCHCVQGVCGETCQRLCNATSKCDAHPCWFGSTCIDIANLHYVCLCPPNYTGRDCRTIVACHVDACFNGGTCIQTPLGVQCKCPDGASGDFCQYLREMPTTTKKPSPAEFRHFDEQALAAISALGLSGAGPQTFNQRVNSIVIAMGDATRFVYCLTNPCENGGSCFITNTATTKGICVCRVGYVGDYCEILYNNTSIVAPQQTSYCSSNPCMNGGTCVEVEIYNGYCRCHSEYRGIYCETPIRSYGCEPNPCKNGGSCILLDNNQARCICTSVFRGVTCNQFSYVPCGDGTCHGAQGTCLSNKCICKRGFAGPRCDSTDFCSAYPCLNGGTCIRTNDEPYGGCSCPSEYSGPTCSNDPCSPSPCLNGGHCVRKPDNQFYCQCRNRNKGVYCEQQECFPSDATVDVLNGGKVRLSALKIGDQVRIMNEQNEISYSPVIAFLHREPDEEATYKRIRTKNAAIELSDRHLIHRRNDGFIWAEQLGKNDEILVASSKNLNKTNWERIIEITEVTKEGVMAPLTEQGTIIVNNVHTSCYALVKSHTLGHIALAPFRWYHRVFGHKSDNNSSPILNYASILLHLFKTIPVVKDILF